MMPWQTLSFAVLPQGPAVTCRLYGAQLSKEIVARFP